MTEYSDDYCEQEFHTRKEKFNAMLRSGSVGYFDVCELEELTDHFLENFDHENAAKVAELAIQLHPDSLSAKYMAARGCAITGQHKQALALIGELESVEFLNEDIYLLKGSLLSELKEFKPAAESFKKALTLSTDRFDEIHVDLAFQYINLRNFKKAIDSLKAALHANPENETALHELEYCYHQLDKGDDLIGFYRDFLDEHPYSWAAWYNLGVSLFKSEKYVECVDAFDFCLAIDEEFTPAHFNRANALIQIKRYAEAIESFEAMMNQTGMDDHLLCYIGECYEKMEDYDRAASAYARALIVDETCAEAMIGLNVVRGLQDESTVDLALYETALEIEPDVDSYWHLYATAALHKGEVTKAEKAYQQCLNLDSEDQDAWEEYADLKASLGQYDDAVDILYVAYYRLGYDFMLIIKMALYKSMGNSIQEAEDLLSLALNENPDGIEEFLTFFPEAQNDPLIARHVQSGKKKL